MRALLLLALLLVAAATADAHVPPGARGGGAVASAISDEQMIAARTKYFGVENVDQRTGALPRDRVLLSWYGVTNFALAIRGHVLLLDAWLPRGAHSGYVPTTTDELAQLRPEYVLLGHAHFDHAADAVPLALAGDATLVGTAEHCAALAARSPTLPPRCVTVAPEGAAPGHTEHPDLLPGVAVTVVKHLHSAGAPNDGMHVPAVPVPGSTFLENPPTPEDLAHLLGHLPDAEGGSLVYRLEVGDFTMVWNDSAGPLSERAPEVLGVLGALGPVDLQVGAIQSFNQLINGLRDPVEYIEAIRPSLFIPSHPDDWVAGITTKGENYREPFFAELATIADPPEVRFITDPADYLQPLAFPARLDPLRLVRRCGARMRVRLRGDVADVVRVRLRGGRRTRADRTAPFAARLPRAARRIRARVVLRDGTSERQVARGCRVR